MPIIGTRGFGENLRACINETTNDHYWIATIWTFFNGADRRRPIRMFDGSDEQKKRNAIGW